MSSPLKLLKLHDDASALMDMNTEELGEKIYDQVTGDESGSFREMGKHMRAVIRQAKAGSINPLEAVENTLIAISGSGFATTAGLPNESA